MRRLRSSSSAKATASAWPVAVVACTKTVSGAASRAACSSAGCVSVVLMTASLLDRGPRTVGTGRRRVSVREAELLGEGRGPGTHDALPALRVVGEQVGQGQPPGHVEGGLDEGAHPRVRVVDAEVSDGRGVDRTGEATLGRCDEPTQLLVRRGGGPRLQRGAEELSGVDLGHVAHDTVDPLDAVPRVSGGPL